MQFKTLTSLAALLSIATAYTNSNQLNLWTDTACSVPDQEITLTATGCACNNIASPGAFSVSAAVTDPNCTPEIYGYSSADCEGGEILVSSEDLTTCVTPGNHAFLSFLVVTPCFTN